MTDKIPWDKFEVSVMGILNFPRCTLLWAMTLCLLSPEVLAAPQTLVFQTATASYRGRDVLSNWKGITKNVTGSLVYDDKTGMVMTGKVQVELATIDSSNELRDARMRNEFLQTAQYPQATFVITTVEGFGKFTEWKRWGIKERGKITGDLTVRNITRPVTFEGEAVYTGRELQLTGISTVKMSDFGITPPSLLLVTVEDAVTLEISAVATGPRPKLLP
jgi:polyisoprenoid-binding protein YceI